MKRHQRCGASSSHTPWTLRPDCRSFNSFNIKDGSYTELASAQIRKWKLRQLDGYPPTVTKKKEGRVIACAVSLPVTDANPVSFITVNSAALTQPSHEIKFQESRTVHGTFGGSFKARTVTARPFRSSRPFVGLKQGKQTGLLGAPAAAWRQYYDQMRKMMPSEDFQCNLRGHDDEGFYSFGATDQQVSLTVTTETWLIVHS
ncbi:hypothetical protein F2P81_010689 [Scophthalmus maximus]|uniref:Uncharacterized protein n=1 Tax=Scophthalmus maximus TaxID=52904 RepID=A0A6A4SYF7_SCOMX|nr:hypothetical protein F2P81_010689 [Scophthalmus maximus]